MSRPNDLHTTETFLITSTTYGLRSTTRSDPQEQKQEKALSTAYVAQLLLFPTITIIKEMYLYCFSHFWSWLPSYITPI